MTRICAPIVELEGAYSRVISSFPKAVAMSIALMAASPMKVVVGMRGSQRMARATPPNDAHGSNDVLSSTVEIEVKSFGDAESFFEGAGLARMTQARGRWRCWDGEGVADIAREFGLAERKVRNLAA